MGSTIPQKDIIEMNSHLFALKGGVNILKPLTEGKVLTIYIMRGAIQMNSDVFVDEGLYILRDGNASTRIFLRILKKYFPEFVKISSSRDVNGSVYVNTNSTLKTTFQLNREANGCDTYDENNMAHLSVADASNTAFDTVVINFSKTDFTKLAWELFKRDPVDVIRYSRHFPNKTEGTKKHLAELYDSLSDSDKLLLEIDG